jgi:hypothetical protein
MSDIEGKRRGQRQGSVGMSEFSLRSSTDALLRDGVEQTTKATTE